MTDFGLDLLQELDSAEQWPLPREAHAQNLVAVRRALLQSDKEALSLVARWSTRQAQLFVGASKREYVVDPMPALIAEGFADFLWGEDPEITAASGDDTPDDDLLGEIVEENELPASLWDAETICVGEGEVWWHIYVDREAASTPLIEFCSRGCVVPLMRGPRLMACAMVSVVKHNADQVWRVAEVHSPGVTRQAVYAGTGSTLGQQINPESLAETQGLEPEWNHGLDMLAGRILNGRRALHGLGVSEYDRVLDLLFALNEARSIGTENARLTAKKRLFANQDLMTLGPDGVPVFPAGDDIILTDSGGGVVGSGSDKPPVTSVEYSFDAVPLIAHTQELERTILSRVRMVGAMVGLNDSGTAESGTARKLRFLPTTNAANGKAREWDAKLPGILQLSMLVDALAEEAGGFGRVYKNAGEVPSVERADILPRDETESVSTAAVGVQGEVMSIDTAIRDLHPEWDDAAVADEVAKIREDRGVTQVPVESPVPPGMKPDPAMEMPAAERPAGMAGE